MNVRNLYIASGIITLVFALGLLLVTTTMLAMFGLDNTADARMLSQFIGVELVASGLSTLLLRDAMDSNVINAVNYAHIAGNALGFIIALNGTLTGVLNSTGYLIVLIYGLLGAGFVYFQFFAPSR